MDLDDLKTLHAYTRWANARMLDAAARLTSDQIHQALGGSFTTLIATLTHMLGAEWVWLERFHGRSPTGFAVAEGLHEVSEVRARWLDLERDYSAFIASLTPASLEETVSYASFKGDRFTQRLDQLLRHVFNHATYHRGQVAFMLRLLGAQASSTDYVLFLREQA